jgi:hypothetical protein
MEIRMTTPAALLLFSYLAGVWLMVLMHDQIRSSDQHPVYNSPYRKDFQSQGLLILCIALAFAAGAVAAWGEG